MRRKKELGPLLLFIPVFIGHGINKSQKPIWFSAFRFQALLSATVFQLVGTFTPPTSCSAHFISIEGSSVRLGYMQQKYSTLCVAVLVLGISRGFTTAQTFPFSKLSKAKKLAAHLHVYILHFLTGCFLFCRFSTKGRSLYIQKLNTLSHHSAIRRTGTCMYCIK